MTASKNVSNPYETSRTPVDGAPLSPPPYASSGGGVPDASSVPSAYAPPTVPLTAHVPPRSAPPGYAYPARPVPTGTMSWALGFLAYIPFPVVSMLIAAIAMVCVYPSTRRKDVPLATQNARIAANWGLTIIAYYVVSALYMVGLSLLFPETLNAGFLPFGWPIVGYMLLCVLHLIVIIMGTLAAKRGEVFRNALGIPFLRASSGRRDSSG